MNDVQSGSASSKLVSQLVIDDPEMLDIVTEFVGDLPGRIAEMQNAHREIAALLERGFIERRDDQFSDLVAQLQRLADAAAAGLAKQA